jgi:hypothetical protein
VSEVSERSPCECRRIKKFALDEVYRGRVVVMLATVNVAHEGDLMALRSIAMNVVQKF